MAALSRHEELAKEELESLVFAKPSAWNLPVAIAQGATIAVALHVGSNAGIFTALGCGVAYASFHLAYCANAYNRKVFRQLSALQVVQRAAERRSRSGEA